MLTTTAKRAQLVARYLNDEGFDAEPDSAKDGTLVVTVPSTGYVVRIPPGKKCSVLHRSAQPWKKARRISLAATPAKAAKLISEDWNRTYASFE